MNACHRGCRLYSICQFVNGNAGFNTSKEECQGGEDTKGRKPKYTLSSGPNELGRAGLLWEGGSSCNMEIPCEALDAKHLF